MMTRERPVPMTEGVLAPMSGVLLTANEEPERTRPEACLASVETESLTSTCQDTCQGRSSPPSKRRKRLDHKVELAGLEPATSWVRFRRSLRLPSSRRQLT